MNGKNIVTGIAVYLIAKGILNLLLGGFGVGNIVSLVIQIALAAVLIKAVPKSNYIAAILLVAVALYHFPANLGNLSANWIYLLEGILDIGVAALLAFAKDVRTFFDHA